MTGDNSQHTVRPGPTWRVHKTLCALTFVAAAVAVYQWGRVRAERTGSPGDYTATAMVRWQATTPAGNADHSLSPGLQSFARHLEHQIASEENVRRAMKEQDRSLTCLPDKPDQRDKKTFQQAVADVQRNLRAVAEVSPESGRARLSITCTQPHAQYAISLVNILAEHCADDYRVQWKAAAERAFAVAQDAAHRAQEDFHAARAQLDEFCQQQLKSRKSQAVQPTQVSPPAVEPQIPRATISAEPEPVENPEWVVLHGQLEELQRRRTALLRDRTAEHPAVKDVDFRIADLTDLLATKPRWIATERPEPQPPVANRLRAASPPPIGTPGDSTPAASRDGLVSSQATKQQVQASETFEKLKDAVDRAEQAREMAARRERQAWQAMLLEPQIEVEPAASCETPPSAVADLRLLLTALGSAFLVTLGMGMILAAATRVPTVATIAEVEALLLPVPVVGIVPAAAAAGHCGPAYHRHLWLRAMLLGGGLLVVAFWAGFLLLIFDGH